MSGWVTPERKTLANGLQAWVFPVPHLRRAHVGVTLRAGPVNETDETWGMSHVLEHMLFRGTQSWPTARALSLHADDLGGEVAGATYRDRVLYDLRCDRDRVGPALALLHEMVTSPRLRGLRIEKDIIREELLDAYDERGQHIDVDNVVYQDLFGDAPLGRSIDGSLSGVEALTRPALRRFFRAQYGPARAAVVVVAPTTARAGLRAIQKHFGSWQPQGVPIAGVGAARPPRAPHGVRVVRTEQSQTQLRLCFRIRDPDADTRIAGAVLARVLDDGPASRLQGKLVDEQGLCYSLWAQLDTYEGEAVFEFGAQVAHDRVVPLVESLVHELRAVQRTAPQQVELARARRRWHRDLNDLYENPMRLVESSSRRALFGQGWTPARTMSRVRSLTGGALRDVARSTFRAGDDMSMVLVGQPQGVQAVRSLVNKLA